MALTIGEANDVVHLLQTLAGHTRWQDLSPGSPASADISAAVLRLRDKAATRLQVGGNAIITEQEVINFLDEWREEGDFATEYEPRHTETINTHGRT